ncbi:ABC transporter permease [Neobacillus niacini]|uniref:ABC transporter permease n=1 Tax=Neobacillus niacini TaxID=86668 RepID=UPI001C8DF2E2|nr:ABC transporter permease [Neobacillus niacini]MBY0147726.1 ABC transporter permease [Neobacillus niacini]
MTFRQFAFRNVTRNKRTYAAYFLSSAFSVMIFFFYALFIFHPDISKGVTSGAAIQIMTAAEVIMYVFSFLFVLYSVSTFLKSRKREFGILMMHGMTRNQLNTMIFLENMLIGVASIITGIGAGIITGKLFLMIGSRMIGIESLPFFLSGKALGWTIGAFLILFLCISIFTSFLVRVNHLIDLFKAGEKPKKEPKVSKVLSIISAILLITSYYLAATTTLQNMLTRILPVIGMTIIGTYFFYTQLSVFLTKLLQKNRLVFWKKTNIITISSLAYRLKDNARMFFLVTIVSTVAFCAVGTLASMNVFKKEFVENYPAAITYVAKGDDPSHDKNIEQIKQELKEKNIDYSTLEFTIKFVEVADSSDEYARQWLPVVAFSDYKKSSEMAGYTFTEKEVTGTESLALSNSALETFDPQTYTLKQENIKLSQKNKTEHVVLPHQVLFAEGLVISDEIYKKLSEVRSDTFTGFYTKEFDQTVGIGGHLVEEGAAHAPVDAEKMDPKKYAMTVSGTIYQIQVNRYRMMLFVALLIGAVFFIAAGSFLYFRLYADLDYDRRLYLTVKKVGLTDGELNKIVTQQLVLLFFVPIMVAIIHSVFAFMALQSFFTVSIAADMLLVLACFFIAQVIYFLFIRHHYLRNLKKTMI